MARIRHLAILTEDVQRLVRGRYYAIRFRRSMKPDADIRALLVGHGARTRDSNGGKELPAGSAGLRTSDARHRL
jgi:hypothetical protein